MKFITKFYGFFSARIEVLKKAIDVRDVLVFGGISLAGYGLYMVYPALSFIVCGSFLVCLGMGFFVRRPVK
jgi:hypothetical protein